MKVFAFTLAFTLAAFAQQHPLTNSDVVRMVEQGNATDAVVQSIKTARAVEFRVSPDYTPQLEKLGVPKEIIDAMIRRVMDDESRSPGRSEPEKTAKPIQPAPKPNRAATQKSRPEPEIVTDPPAQAAPESVPSFANGATPAAATSATLAPAPVTPPKEEPPTPAPRGVRPATQPVATQPVATQPPPTSPSGPSASRSIPRRNDRTMRAVTGRLLDFNEERYVANTFLIGIGNLSMVARFYTIDMGPNIIVLRKSTHLPNREPAIKCVIGMNVQVVISTRDGRDRFGIMVDKFDNAVMSGGKPVWMTLFKTVMKDNPQ